MALQNCKNGVALPAACSSGQPSSLRTHKEQTHTTHTHKTRKPFWFNLCECVSGACLDKPVSSFATEKGVFLSFCSPGQAGGIEGRVDDVASEDCLGKTAGRHNQHRLDPVHLGLGHNMPVGHTHTKPKKHGRFHGHSLTPIVLFVPSLSWQVCVLVPSLSWQKGAVFAFCAPQLGHAGRLKLLGLSENGRRIGRVRYHHYSTRAKPPAKTVVSCVQVSCFVPSVS
jgi:hypothetical protein